MGYASAPVYPTTTSFSASYSTTAGVTTSPLSGLVANVNYTAGIEVRGTTDESVTIASVTGPGVVDFLALRYADGQANANCVFRVYIDDAVKFTWTRNNGGAGIVEYAVLAGATRGSSTTGATPLTEIPFRNSFRVTVQNASTTIQGQAYYHYRRVN